MEKRKRLQNRSFVFGFFLLMAGALTKNENKQMQQTAPTLPPQKKMRITPPPQKDKNKQSNKAAALPNEQPKEVRLTLYLLYSVQLLHGEFHGHTTPTPAAGAATAVTAAFAGGSGGFGVADGVSMEVKQKHTLVLVLATPFIDAVHFDRA